MLKPQALKSGDRVSLVSPASPFSRVEFDRGVEVLRKRGYEPVWDESLFKRDGFVSGSAELRAKAFTDAWEDPSIAALIAVRGGYGSVELLPLLDGLALKDTPKIFIGSSDNTSLLTLLTVGHGLVGFHGPMIAGPFGLASQGLHEDSWKASLESTEAPGELLPEGVVTLNAGEASGPIFGGTLTQLVSSLGTPYAFMPPDGSVLFLEEINESPYRLSRMLVQLKLAGIFTRVPAVICGEMYGCNGPDGSPTSLDVVKDIFKDFPGPIVSGFPSGHSHGACWTLPLGVRGRVIADSHPRLVIEEAAVT